jgi:hypothetical protein
MSIASLLTTLVVVATLGTGAVYSIGPGPVPWLQGRHRRRVRAASSASSRTWWRRSPGSPRSCTLGDPFRTQHPLGAVVNRPSVWSDR